MRKFTLFLMSLFLSVGAMAQVDYSTNYDGQGKSGRAINWVALTSPAFGEQKVELTNAENNSLVVDKTSIVFKCNVGETVSPTTGYTAGWMHTYIYLDADNNGFIAEDVNAVDLVSFAYYNGKNSLGSSVADNVVNAPSFTAPTTPGTYRMRYKIDWDDINPKGSTVSGNTMSKNNGGIVDVMLEVKALPVYTVTYNYKQNGVLVGSVEHQVAQGSEYPALVSGLYNVTVNGSKPTGTVTEDAEFDIDVTLGVFPFEYYEDYAAVEEANGWYNLIMHSNWNTGAAAARYRTYVGAGDETNLAWGTERSLTNPTNDYYWAFVGNPITGFSIVNKAKGATQILSSNGSTNPVMLEAEGLANGYNTTWQIRERKYNVSQQGDYILEGAWFCLKYPNSSNYINANAGNGNVAFWNDNDNGSAILAVKPLEINEAADVATYYSDNYIVKPAGAEVYYVNNVEDGYAKFAEVTGDNIPAQNGVVVKFTTNENIVYAPEITSAGATAAIEGNMLKGTTKRTLITKETNKAYYVLGMTKGVGFYNAVNGENEGEFYNGAYKAYLEIEGANETATFYGFDWAGTTGINEVKGENGNVKTIYDLTGRRIEAITAPGIYIVGGKKVLVK
jgi:hypothetical protein